MPQKPMKKDRSEMCLYRAQLSCQIGRDAIDGKGTPIDCTAMEYAMFNLLHAVEEIAKAMQTKDS